MSDVMIRLEQASTDAVEWMRKNMEYVKDIDGERDQLKADLAKLQAEREPRDNGDGTVTQLLPVTYPAGLPVECARSPNRGDRYFGDGDQFTAVDDHRQERVRLILRPAPKPPEPVTWEAPALTDGEWIADGFGSHGEYYSFRWGAIRGLSKPAKLGRYQLKDGVGTLIQEAE